MFARLACPQSAACGRASLLLLDIGGGIMPVDMGSRSQVAPGDGLAVLLQLGIGGGHAQRAIFGGLSTLVKGSAFAALLQVEGGLGRADLRGLR